MLYSIISISESGMHSKAAGGGVPVTMMHEEAEFYRVYVMIMEWHQKLASFREHFWVTSGLFLWFECLFVIGARWVFSVLVLSGSS